MQDTIYIKGVWYEVEVTDCNTWVIFRDRDGKEVKFRNDTEDAPKIANFIFG